MHILKIIHGYPPNYNAGSEVYSQSICDELSKQHKVSVFTREENPYLSDFSIRYQKDKNNTPLDFYFVNNPQGKDGYRHQQIDNNFSKLISKIKPDIAHIGHLNHLSTGIIDELNKQKIPIIFTLHDFWLMCPRGQFLTRSIGKKNNFQLCNKQENEKCATNCYEVYFSGIDKNRKQEIESWSNWTHQRMAETKSIIDKVDLFIAPSNYLRDRFITDFKVDKNKIIYLDYGFPTEYLTPTEKQKDNSNFNFGYIGTHIPAKGINQLIEAISQIEEPTILKIYGRNNGQSTKALQTMASLSKNKIEFVGEYINKNLANEVFSKIDCIVVPSIWGENSPLVIHEAQSCKIPVITADFGGMKEYVQHKINGLLFEHRNTNSLQEQLEFAIQNPNLMKQYGQKGYLFSESGSVPNIKNHCEELVMLYQKCMQKNNVERINKKESNTEKPQKKLWRITIDTNPEDCNLKCIMCEEHSPYSDFIPTLYRETSIKSRRMKFETVEDIFLQAEKLGVKEIIPSTMGEPLLYKQFDKLFELAEQKNIKINLTTNGTFPKKTVQEWAKLIVPNTTDIKISWNSSTEETAKKVMIGIDFQKSIENVKEFIRYRNEYFEKTGYFCRVTFQLTFMQNNMHELSDIIKLAASLGVDRVKGHQLWTHFEEIENLSMKTSEESILQWNQYVKKAYETQEEFRKPNGEKILLENIISLQEYGKKEVPQNYECPFLNQELWISPTGKISPCCAPDNLRKTLGDFGNIATTTIQEVLESAIYTELATNYKQKTLCKTCNMRKPV